MLSQDVNVTLRQVAQANVASQCRKPVSQAVSFRNRSGGACCQYDQRECSLLFKRLCRYLFLLIILPAISMPVTRQKPIRAKTTALKICGSIMDV